MFNPRQFLNKLIIFVVFLIIIVGLITPFFFEESTSLQPQVLTKPLSKTSDIFDETILQNHTSKTKVLLEKVKEDLLFFGTLKRPKEPTKLFFSLKDKPELIAVKNKEVSLISHLVVLKAELQGESVLVELSLGEEILEFKSEKSNIPFNLTQYKVGSISVDSAFLVKAKAKFIGQDLFMQRHSNKKERHRLDFEDYTLYVNEGSCLYFEGGIWKEGSEVRKTLNCPLIEIKKIDERSLHALFYAPNLPLEIPITLGKYPDLSIPPKAPISFSYVGSRNFKEWLFDVDGKKESVQEGDWWLLTDGGWRLLDQEIEIDDYVSRKLIGELFIVDSIQRYESEKILKGHSYNNLRTKEYEIQLPLKPKKSQYPPTSYTPQYSQTNNLAISSRVDYAY